jgi:hypothetical protein
MWLPTPHVVTRLSLVATYRLCPVLPVNFTSERRDH